MCRFAALPSMRSERCSLVLQGFPASVPRVGCGGAGAALTERLAWGRDPSREGDCVRLLTYSPPQNGHCIGGWSRPKPETWDSGQVPRVGGSDPQVRAAFCFHGTSV